MTHFGIICPAATGHINPMFPLARALQQRGHKITVFGTPIVQARVEAAGFGMRLIGEIEFSIEKVVKFYAKLGELSGLTAIEYTFQGIAKRAEINLRETSKAAKEENIEALIIDQICFEGATIAEYLNVPFITVCGALLTNEESTVPPWIKPWGYKQAWWALLRNKFGYYLFYRIKQPIREVISEYRQKWNLPACSNEEDYNSKLAIICQQPAEFEFPRKNLPPYFHFTRPIMIAQGDKW